MCKLAMVLYLNLITSCMLEWPIDPNNQSKIPSRATFIHMTILGWCCRPSCQTLKRGKCFCLQVSNVNSALYQSLVTPSKRTIVRVALFCALCGCYPNKKHSHVLKCVCASHAHRQKVSFYPINTSDGHQTGTGNVTRHLRHRKLASAVERSQPTFMPSEQQLQLLPPRDN